VSLAVLVVAVLLGVSCTAGAQTPQVPPQQGFKLHDQKQVDRFVVQRWVDSANPEVSPAGFCECITVVYEGTRRLFTPALDTGILAVSTVTDVTGDKRAELVMSYHSGGAHCCYTTSIYSVEPGAAAPKAILNLNTDDCSGELEDLDKDGVAEFRTCDPVFGYAFCSFAFTPFPPAVFAYDRQKGEYVLSTVRYARYLQLQSEADALAIVKEYPNDAEAGRCSALGAALGLIYTGRVTEGQALFRKLYRGADAAAIEAKALEMARASSLWMER
jgi:hypothetical protein